MNIHSQTMLDTNTWLKSFSIGQHQILLIFIISRNKTAYCIWYSLEVTCSCSYFVSLGWRYSDQQMRFNKYFLYEYVNWLSIASKTWHITPRTLLPFHIYFVETMKCRSISVSAHWDVAATVCRSIWMPTQCGVGIEDENTTLSLFNLNERTKKWRDELLPMRRLTDSKIWWRCQITKGKKMPLSKVSHEYTVNQNTSILMISVSENFLLESVICFYIWEICLFLIQDICDDKHQQKIYLFGHCVYRKCNLWELRCISSTIFIMSNCL
jgi:hypothetical protein